MRPQTATQEVSWTARDHWVVMVRERFDTERCIAHYEFKHEATAHAARARANYGHDTRVWVKRSQ